MNIFWWRMDWSLSSVSFYTLPLPPLGGFYFLKNDQVWLFSYEMSPSLLGVWCARSSAVSSRERRLLDWSRSRPIKCRDCGHACKSVHPSRRWSGSGGRHWGRRDTSPNTDARLKPKVQMPKFTTKIRQRQVHEVTGIVGWGKRELTWMHRDADFPEAGLRDVPAPLRRTRMKL